MKEVETMETQDILFQYLKDIIYDTKNANLNLEDLPSEYQKLGQGMQLLQQWIDEALEMSVSISKGDLSYVKTDVENIFAAPMKELQSTLKHITWQTDQVSKGDYSQTVDFMGDFSRSFNTMTKQLQERRDALIHEKQMIEHQKAELENAFQLVMGFANHTHNMVFIHSLQVHGDLFKNSAASSFVTQNIDIGALLLNRLFSKDKENVNKTEIWDVEIEDRNQKVYYYTVETYPIYWSRQKALVHIVLDDTARRIHEKQMYELVYIDSLTGLYNRRFAIEQMKDFMNRGISFVLSFIDIDYLKYCNDTFGHMLGDEYLLRVVQSLKEMGGILCRTGGDEFMLIQIGKTVQSQDYDLEKKRLKVLEEGKEKPYPQSFSYASCLVDSYSNQSLDDYLILVDSLMYQYKIKNKKPLKDTLYQDDR